MLHIKAKNVPFHSLHGSLICSKRLQSNRQKCGGILADPGPPQKSFKNQLSVGSDYRFLYQPIALDILYFHVSPVLLFSFLFGPGSTSIPPHFDLTLRKFTLQALGADQASIKQIKGEIQGFQMRHEDRSARGRKVTGPIHFKRSTPSYGFSSVFFDSAQCVPGFFWFSLLCCTLTISYSFE